MEAVLLELHQMREERRRERQEQQNFRAKMEARFVEREAAFRRMEERLNDTQLSRSNNISAGEAPTDAARVDFSSGRGNATGDRASFSLRVKTDTYDGTVPLREFLSQFSFISRANGWDEASQTVALASCLRGKARSVLDGLSAEKDKLTFSELKSELELRFGESELAQNFYLQFTNGKLLPGEDYATLGADLERLSRKVYPNCPHEMRDKVACAQFVAALSDGFVKRTLQVEGVSSLRVAIERARTLKFINENSFAQKPERQGSGNSGVKENKSAEDLESF